MKKSKFINLLRSPENIHQKELELLKGLADNYPYSQALHILVAKGSHSISAPDADTKISHAAVHTADRKNLKQLIENIHTIIVDDSGSDSIAAPSAVPEGAVSHTNDKLKGEIQSYVEKLKREKLALQFQSETGISDEVILEREQFINDLDVKIDEAESKLEKLELTDDSAIVEEKAQIEEVSENIVLGKEELYIELQENLQSLNNYRQSEKENSDQDPNDSTADHPTESKEINDSEVTTDAVETFSNNIEKERMEKYLASLKASNEEESISNEKLKNQIKIINEFIENEPKLSRLEREENLSEKRVDLSLKSLKVQQNMASENLALIMVKQGKLEKAEEIYHKLIWKFPEKKAYFVAQIEDLKKK